MSSEKQESMLKKVLTHAVLTVTGVLVTAYATNLIKQTQFDEQKQEQAKQLVESSRVTNERLNDYMQRYDDLLAKYEELLKKRRKDGPPPRAHRPPGGKPVDGGTGPRAKPQREE